MVYITTPEGIEKKYACIKCIKGHRSSKCTHNDRELIEIKRKGRPVSQCENCRLLRRTKHVHVKCKCLNRIDISEFQQHNDSQKPNSLFSERNNHNATLASTSCVQCERPKLYCVCPKSPQETLASSSSSDGSLTPPVYNAQHTSSPSSSSSSLPFHQSPLQKLSLRHLTIPIHDPSDDIDSDTPIYKPTKEDPVDEAAVLGEFSNKSSEELMNQIYSGFRPDSASLSANSPHLREEDDTLVELSKQEPL